MLGTVERGVGALYRAERDGPQPRGGERGLNSAGFPHSRREAVRGYVGVRVPAVALGGKTDAGCVRKSRRAKLDAHIRSATYGAGEAPIFRGTRSDSGMATMKPVRARARDICHGLIGEAWDGQDHNHGGARKRGSHIIRCSEMEILNMRISPQYVVKIGPVGGARGWICKQIPLPPPMIWVLSRPSKRHRIKTGP